ncbi:MAG TPA: hypothetical protein VHP80_08760, partial [Candidatus Acidoferrum sp.]|nr:hypothetical protein [Candidatus Acidoferrum sp.]
NPRCSAHHVYEPPAWLTNGAHLLRAQADAKLRACGQAARRGDVRREQGAQRLLRRFCVRGALSAFAKVSGEPLLLYQCKTFYSLFRDE